MFMCFSRAALISFHKIKITSALGLSIIHFIFVFFFLPSEALSRKSVGDVSLLALNYFSALQIPLKHTCSLYLNPGCPLDWAGAKATRFPRVRHPAGSPHQWQSRVDAWGPRPGETGSCWPGLAPRSCGERGRARAKVVWLTTRSSRAAAYPELAWSLSWTAGRWLDSWCCCSSPARWWRQRGRGGHTHTQPEQRQEV